MRYSGIQPHYFPRLHYFARILQTDIFVIRDDVQFVRKHKYPDGKNGKSYQAHTPIKHASGLHFLMIPIIHDGYKSIRDTKIQYNSNWVEEHLKTIQTTYSNAPYFSVVYPQLQKLLTKKYENLAELNIATIIWAFVYLLNLHKVKQKDITLGTFNTMLKKQKNIRLKKILLGSESKSLTQNNSMTANEKIVSLLKEIGANEDYCGGTAMAAYMDKELFEKNGIKIVVQDWNCKEYPQLFLKHQPFIPNLSIIDLFMNVSQKEAFLLLQGKL